MVEIAMSTSRLLTASLLAFALLTEGAPSSARAAEGSPGAPSFAPSNPPAPPPPPIPVADASADPWRPGSATIALNVGVASAVGFLGVTYSYVPGSVFETELGAGLGFTGVQLSFMQKLALGQGRTRFILGAGLAYSPGGGFVEPNRQRNLWLNLDLAGIEFRAQNHLVFFLAVGDTHEFGAPLELFSIDCLETTNACADAKRDWFQIRTGFGFSF
jgi:hypothetical protein